MRTVTMLRSGKNSEKAVVTDLGSGRRPFWGPDVSVAETFMYLRYVLIKNYGIGESRLLPEKNYVIYDAIIEYRRPDEGEGIRILRDIYQHLQEHVKEHYLPEYQERELEKLLPDLREYLDMRAASEDTEASQSAQSLGKDRASASDEEKELLEFGVPVLVEEDWDSDDDGFWDDLDLSVSSLATGLMALALHAPTFFVLLFIGLVSGKPQSFMGTYLALVGAGLLAAVAANAISSIRVLSMGPLEEGTGAYYRFHDDGGRPGRAFVPALIFGGLFAFDLIRSSLSVEGIYMPAA